METLQRCGNDLAALDTLKNDAFHKAIAHATDGALEIDHRMSRFAGAPAESEVGCLLRAVREGKGTEFAANLVLEARAHHAKELLDKYLGYREAWQKLSAVCDVFAQQIREVEACAAITWSFLDQAEKIFQKSERSIDDPVAYPASPRAAEGAPAVEPCTVEVSDGAVQEATGRAGLDVSGLPARILPDGAE
eukprot:gnl/Chilomastix_cuspidata/3695.p3 GENE.gnl/Chilomastix_cuspidata/3695~~gnl/Chilomastix_cuspidata/3695.p3  ORF type:complete len:192 (-),score=120.44 gnl/Chilomastix_cuspidata/3695:525-1100(-)